MDTTEEYRADQRLRELTEQLEHEVLQRTRERDRIWQLSEDLLGVGNFEGYYLSVNPAWSKLLGWSEDELKRMHVEELRHPEDASAARAGRGSSPSSARRARRRRRTSWAPFALRTSPRSGRRSRSTTRSACR